VGGADLRAEASGAVRDQRDDAVIARASVELAMCDRLKDEETIPDFVSFFDCF
jgi:hypothetical protein